MIEIFINLVRVLIVFLKAEIYLIQNIESFLFKLITKLDCDARSNVYIAVTGIFIAIVIFVAEIISGKKREVYKKLILKRTNIIQNVLFMTFVLILIWFSNLIDSQSCKYIYFYFQLLINIGIFKSIVDILKMFFKCIKLNTDENFLNEQLEEYIHAEVLNFCEGNRSRSKKYEERKKEFEAYIQSSEIFKYEAYLFNINGEYGIVYSNENGYISSYNFEILNYILDSSKTKITNKSGLIEGNIKKPEIYFCKNIGEQINKGTPIAHYKNLNRNLVNNIEKAIILDKNGMYSFLHMKKIIDDLFLIAKEDKNNFDISRYLLNFYEFLCQTQSNDVLGIFLNKVEEFYFEALKNVKFNESYTTFLVRLVHISFIYNRYEDIEILNSYITYLYCNRMKDKNADLKMIAYDYANHVFVINYYYCKSKSDCRYFDNVMKNLLIFISKLVAYKNIASIDVIFDNIHLEDASYLNVKDMNEYDIIKVQFFIGIVSLMLYSYKKLKAEDLQKIKDLLDSIKDKFFDSYDIWDIMLIFKKCIKKETDVKKMIDNLDINEEDYKYKNAWTLYHIDSNEILKALIYILDIEFVNIEAIDENDIDRNDRYEYEQLKKLLIDHKYERIESTFEYDKYNLDSINKLLDKIILICEQKENKYKIEQSLEENKKEEFKRRVINNCNKKIGLIKLLYDENKVQKSSKKLKVTLGINQLIPRNIFFKDVYGLENIADDYGRAFPRGINSELLKRIKSYSEYIKDDFETVIEKIENINNYVVIMNTYNFRKINLEHEEEYLKINNVKVKVIIINEINEIIIVNKNSLPQVEICDFDDSYNRSNINENVYYELNDCSGNQSLIEEIMNKNNWLKEKGDIEQQINYLSRNCELKIFMAYKILEPAEKSSFIIENKSLNIKK